MSTNQFEAENKEQGKANRDEEENAVTEVSTEEVASAVAAATQQQQQQQAGENADNEMEKEDSSDNKESTTQEEFFLAQLKEITDSISSSFDSIAATMEDLRVKAGTIASLSASLVNGTGEVGPKGIADKDIDGRLMLLEVAQQAQNGLVKAAESLAAGNSLTQYQDLNPRRLSSGSGSVPEIDLNPRAKNVYDLWDEWTEGYRGQRPLKFLELHFGTKWRRGRIAKSAQRRKKVVEFIEGELKRFPMKKPAEVVRDLDIYRKSRGKGLFWLYGSLPDRLYDDAGNVAEGIRGVPAEEPPSKRSRKSDTRTMDEVAEATAAAAVAAQDEHKEAEGAEAEKEEADATTDPALAKMGLEKKQ